MPFFRATSRARCWRSRSGRKPWAARSVRGRTWGRAGPAVRPWADWPVPALAWPAPDVAWPAAPVLVPWPAPAADPYYKQYPFQTPSQASRQLDADRRQRQNTEAVTDAIMESQRRSEAAADARDFQRRLDAIYGR